MNILHITTYLQGGAGRIIYQLASNQQKAGHRVVVVTSKTSEPGYNNYVEYVQELHNNGIVLYEIDSTFKRDIYLNIHVAEKVRELIEKESMDIIHAHAAVPALVGVVARAGKGKYIPVIQTMHGWGTNKTPEHEKMDITILNGLDKVVSVSKSDKVLMENKGVESNRIITIYNGIDDGEDSTFEEDEVIKEILRYRNEGFKIFGCIGTVCKRKNQELLVEAINKLDRNEKVFCAFIGEGDMIEPLKEKVKLYALENRIKFYGYKQSGSKYIKHFDYLVLPSLSEGFGLVVVEAFREKVPVIASDINVFKELIDDEETGYLFINDDVQSLRDLLHRTLCNHEDGTKIVERAYKRYIDNFRLDIMFNKYNSLYSDLLTSFMK
ncbi:glycosyltransferase family 4 protein [Aneurinibacillus danicus]|uniref:Glycosyl transferase n=1 Tax=Aneurinibacillus danicus TaxID=267746 RepID=A0A511VG52_9BACL|nr:glycosyltransferase family 4 protein [Aneurinibacillus danicus]GEN36202.1 hypothetical protein ADA01nite_36620 [Aneurinibacillus danicus]